MPVARRFRGIVAGALFLLSVGSTATAKYSGGSGTAQDPYKIATAADLIALGETPGDYDKHFILTADIDLDPNLLGRKVFDKAVIGSEWPFFSGVFDGNSHTVSHLTITGDNHLGLFGKLASGAEVRDLGLVNVEISGGRYVGALVGANGSLNDAGGDLTRCYSTGALSGGSSVGGLVGDNYSGSVTWCYSTGAVNGGESVGGLVGHNYSGSVTRCYSTGTVSGGGCGIGGLLGGNGGTVIRCYSTGLVTGPDYAVGGLVGSNVGSIAMSYSTGSVSGGQDVGGLAGFNDGDVTDCCSTGVVCGRYDDGGGLVGMNWGDVARCYSTGAVTVGGTGEVGGLVGENLGTVTQSFWDTQTSGQAASAGGTGKTTAEMQTASTFLDAEWACVDETTSDTEGIWWINEAKGYPRLVWESLASSPYPVDGAFDIVRMPALRWRVGTGATEHDVYFGEDKDTVAKATPDTRGVYRGRQPARTITHDPGTLEWSKTYYWRIDEVSEGDPNSLWKGKVWSFTTTACIKSPQPPDGATDVVHRAILSWVPGEPGMQYDVYLGQNENDVRGVTPQTPGIYRGRQASDVATYQPGDLNLNTTYYWRIDGVDKASPQSPWKGAVWSFTTGIGVAVADDFESYTDDEGKRIYQTWIDGLGPEPNVPGNGTGSVVGNENHPFAEQQIIHGGKQSMPMDYNNTNEPWYSEAQRTWDTPQDWTIEGADTLTLYFRGNPVSFMENAGVVTMSGSGAGTSYGPYGCRFAYKRLNGNGSIVAKIERIGGTGAEAGVIIRESLDPGSACVYMSLRASGGVYFSLYWPGTGSNSTHPGIIAPQWMKLTRTGNAFTAEYSSDGRAWTTVCANATIPMATSAYIGLAVSSGNPELTATGVFSDIATTGDVTREWQLAAIGGAGPQTGNVPQNLYVRIEDGAGKHASVVHPDAEAVLASEWQTWHIALADVRAAGVDVAAVRKMVIGVGDRKNPRSGGTGRIYIDDIRLTKRLP